MEDSKVYYVIYSQAISLDNRLHFSLEIYDTILIPGFIFWRWAKSLRMVVEKSLIFVFAYRSTFSPIFSSGKLKKMTQLIRVLNNKIEDTFDEYAESGQGFNVKDEMGKYSLDAISSCGFGLDAGSLGKKEDSEFAWNVMKFN